MQLIEQHVIGKNDPRYSVIDEAAFKSKNLYNAALYEIKHKTEGRNILVYTVQAISKRGLKRGLVQPSMLPISIKTQQKKLGTTGTTRHTERIITKRNRRIDHSMHTASRQVIDLLVEEGIGTLVIGKNDSWKQECEMGKRNNQNFVQIPHARFIAMLTPDMNADLNGAYNIVRKVAPDAFTAEGVEDGRATPYVVYPVRMTLTKPKKRAFYCAALFFETLKRYLCVNDLPIEWGGL